MTKSTEQLRRDAKTLRRAHQAGDSDARAAVRAFVQPADKDQLKHADYLHIVARQSGFASWPALVASAELHGLDRAAHIQRLTIAMAEGQDHVVRGILSETPDLAEATLALAAGFYRREAVTRMLADSPGTATAKVGSAPPFIHFCRSRMLRLFPEAEADMLAIAEMFLAQGVDVNEGLPWPDDPGHMLSPLYFALGHAGNLPLARWLLAQGATPNDTESLYHATELGHLDGVRLLLEFGADPAGTNALPRAMDFDNADMVKLLLDAGADPNEFTSGDFGGDAPFVVPALHQAARRLSSPEIVDLLLQAGADPTVTWQGKSAFAYAAVYGNEALANRLRDIGADTTLSADESLMAAAARGEDTADRFIDPHKLADEFRNILRNIVHLPGRLPHMQRLVEIGVEYDRPDPVEGLTPVQIAGWEGLPDVMGYFLSLKPDLSHINGYGGTLLSTIIHGSENNPQRDGRDHLACLELALSEGVALPKRAIKMAGDAEVAEFLAEWGARHPGQVVEHGLG